MDGMVGDRSEAPPPLWLWVGGLWMGWLGTVASSEAPPPTHVVVGGWMVNGMVGDRSEAPPPVVVGGWMVADKMLADKMRCV